MPSATTHALADVGLPDRLDLSVGAPCYNKALGLAEFHRRVSATFSKTVGSDYEIIGNWAVLNEFAASDAHV
jgi:hypothetical protein